jgi:hypothetical protein
VPNYDIKDFLLADWSLSKSTSTRRKLFEKHDILTFEAKDATHAKLSAVMKDGHTLVLPHPLDLVFDPTTGFLTVTDLGRILEFSVVAKSQPRSKPQKGLVYKGTFVDGTVEQPDEGGDGDPK